ncbi:hypothetical protein ACWGB8_26430 [Kitasatospora sp. NPDC054939]
MTRLITKAMESRLGLLILMLLFITTAALPIANAVHSFEGQSSATQAIWTGTAFVAVIFSFQSLWFCLGRLVAFRLTERIHAQRDRWEAASNVTTVVARDYEAFVAQLQAHKEAGPMPESLALQYAAKQEEYRRYIGKHHAHVNRLTRRSKWISRAITTAEILSEPPSGYILRRLNGRAPDTNRTLTSIALLLAGPRHAHLRGAWHADLAGAPEEGLVITPRRARHLALGFVVAGIKLRLHTLASPLWVPIDWILASKNRTNNTIVATAGGMAIYCQITGGLHGLLTDGMGSSALTYGSLHTLARALRRHRGIELNAPDHQDPAPNSDS